MTQQARFDFPQDPISIVRLKTPRRVNPWAVFIWGEELRSRKGYARRFHTSASAAAAALREAPQ